ncbi:RDD family protein [Amycolatopsis magusensis]|uniref:RDD family protein n=1 Tax=Amycolatopsis magusensis TaxID=882444 RepID=UPI0024A7EC0D|nr:RDD family protein [Amycolatopsis magusensis]MDI5980613.1 RDD family protein [Amycolatopsis magusensis]
MTVQAEQVPRTADKRLKTFRNGIYFVEAGFWRTFLAWLVDIAVFLLGAGAGVVVLAVVDRTANLGAGALVLGIVGILLLVPLLYGGLCYRNGRALGAVLAGTRLVRFADGGRLGAKAPWAMLIRTILLPLLVFALIAAVFGGSGGAPGGSTIRVSVDVRATARLR